MTDHHPPQYLAAPAVFLIPERHAFLVLVPGRGATWEREFGTACDRASWQRGLVVAVPVLADYSWVEPTAEPPADVQPPAAPDSPSGSGAADEDGPGGFAVGNRDNVSPAGWDFRRTPEDQAPAAGWVGDEPPELPHRETAPAEVVSAGYAALGVAVPPVVIDAMRSTPDVDPDPDVLTRVRAGLRKLPTGPLSGPQADDGDDTVQIDRRPFVRAV